ncbi:hypothetical protein [Kribbella sp. NPDC004875]|uniref:hypothetical protein n=1 Tax=Kribbella sp. NPDC004875 TaxID=3364107 RepID=UPI00369B5358
MDAIRKLPQGQANLAQGVPDAEPGTLFVLTVGGGVRVDAGPLRTILFGRNRPEVHVCVGEDDARVSRMHGAISYRSGQWWVAVTGRLPLRSSHNQKLFAGEDPTPLAPGYTQLFVQGSDNREHVMELYVVA